MFDRGISPDAYLLSALFPFVETALSVLIGGMIASLIRKRDKHQNQS